MFRKLGTLPTWFWASLTADAFFLALGIFLGRWMLPDKAAELYSLIGAALGSFFAVGGAVLLWSIQQDLARARAARILAEICSSLIDRMQRLIDGRPSDADMAFPSSEEVGSTFKACQELRTSIRRFDASWQNLSIDQMAILIRIEGCIDRIEKELAELCNQTTVGRLGWRFKEKTATLTGETMALRELCANVVSRSHRQT